MRAFGNRPRHPLLRAAAGLRVVLVIVVIGLLGAPAAGAQTPDLPNLPGNLQKYVPGSPAWRAAPWTTSMTCLARGGDFSAWARSVIRDAPELLSYFQPKVFGPQRDPGSSAMADAIAAGYRQTADEVLARMPTGLCVDELTRWTAKDPLAKPFGFPWGVTEKDGHQSKYSCRPDAIDPSTPPAQQYNRYVGAERGPCTGFWIECAHADAADKQRCTAWNAFSDDFVRRVDKLRDRAIADHPPLRHNDTDTRLKSPGEIVGDVVGGWFADLTKAFASSAAKMLAWSATYWLRTDRSWMLTNPAIDDVRGMLHGVTVTILVGSLIWQGIQVMWKRKPDPLVSAGLGLLSFVGWSSMSTTLAIVLNEAGVALASQVLDKSIKSFADAVGGSLLGQVGAATGVTFFLSIILLLLGVVQWVLGFFRQGALEVLLALVPTAAAGQLTDGMRPWLRKVLTWCLSLIMYQPICAVVFSIGFLLIGDAKDLSSVMVGVTVVFLATIAMPVMMRFFDWGGQKFAGGGGGGGGAMALGAAASMLGGNGAVSAFTRLMDRTGPGGGSEKPDDDGAPAVQLATHGDGPGGPADPSGGGGQPWGQPGGGTGGPPITPSGDGSSGGCDLAGTAASVGAAAASGGASAAAGAGSSGGATGTGAGSGALGAVSAVADGARAASAAAGTAASAAAETFAEGAEGADEPGAER
ncbi:hypothetical protein [Amycolatopsis sp. WGS_07]|uniref:hypothetical protein n=1 Tax=Amycolatopsis sp. WGS_07 TaxID=3076764 RepID=UPI003873BBE3